MEEQSTGVGSGEDINVGGDLKVTEEVAKVKPAYVFNEDGSVNWRRMIPDEFLYINKEHFQRFNKPIPSSIEGLEDHQLLVKLGGIKHVAKLRGYSSVDYDLFQASREHVVVKCTIDWKPNFLSMHERYTGIGAAHLGNTSPFMHNFLEASAENRAFVRAVRNYLNINIVGDDEITKGGVNPQNEEPAKAPETTPLGIVRELSSKLNITSFEALLDTLEKKGGSKALLENLRGRTNLDDVAVKDLRIIMALLNK